MKRKRKRKKKLKKKAKKKIPWLFSKNIFSLNFSNQKRKKRKKRKKRNKKKKRRRNVLLDEMSSATCNAALKAHTAVRSRF